jgi:hypothetical protein
MDHESRRITQSKVTDLPDRRAGIVAEEFVSQFVHDDSWKRKPGNDESGDDHELSCSAPKFQKTGITSPFSWGEAFKWFRDKGFTGRFL